MFAYLDKKGFNYHVLFTTANWRTRDNKVQIIMSPVGFVRRLALAILAAEWKMTTLI